MAHHLTHYDPFSDLARMDPLRSLEDFFRDNGFRHALRDLGRQAQFKLDVTESEQGYNIKAELPGMKKEDISVQIDGCRVSIAAEVKREHEEKKGETVVRSERHTGQQLRSFLLGQEVDESKAVAKYRDGVLELDLPKRASGTGKKLAIS